MSRPARFLTAALTLATGAAAAHTGQGHDTLSFAEGLRHAVGQPDHLLMLAFGFGLATLAAPRLLAALRRPLQAWRTASRSSPPQRR